MRVSCYAGYNKCRWKLVKCNNHRTLYFKASISLEICKLCVLFKCSFFSGWEVTQKLISFLQLNTKQIALLNEVKNHETTLRSTYGLELSEPLVSFAISRGTWSSPAVSLSITYIVIAKT